MENISKRLEFVIEKCENVTKHFDGAKREEIMLFCLCMLDRLNYASDSLKILTDKFTANTKVDYACGLVIRTVLLDYMIVLNAMEIYGKNNCDITKAYPELKKFCLMMLSDSVKNTLDTFSAMKGKVPQSTLDNLYVNLVNENPECFEPYKKGDIPVLKTKEYKSPKELFKTIESSKELKRFSSVYEAYLFYSKYEHFGQMYYGMSRMKPQERLGRIDQAIRIFPRSLMFTMTILITIYPSDTFLNTELASIMKFIDEIENL